MILNIKEYLSLKTSHALSLGLDSVIVYSFGCLSKRDDDFIAFLYIGLYCRWLTSAKAQLARFSCSAIRGNMKIYDMAYHQNETLVHSLSPSLTHSLSIFAIFSILWIIKVDHIIT